MTWHCPECGWDSRDSHGFDRPGERTHEEHHPYGSSYATETIIDAYECPCCGSEKVEELEPTPEDLRDDSND
jgi:predicted RNA-binding Zn-ribbon protein involved in translation (DUF1610 family)